MQSKYNLHFPNFLKWREFKFQFYSDIFSPLRTCSYQLQRERETWYPTSENVPVSPQSQQCFNLLRHLMSHLNVQQPSNMNHEYLHPRVGQHSLLEYITTVPGDHFVHPSKMYHISTVERETWLHVSCDVSIITIHEIQTLMAGPLIWTISRWGEIYSGVKGDHTIKGLGRETVRDWGEIAG